MTGKEGNRGKGGELVERRRVRERKGMRGKEENKGKRGTMRGKEKNDSKEGERW